MMTKHGKSLHIGLAAGLLVSGAMAPSAATAAIGAPTVKWLRGGCYSSWCETAWYSSPALVDVNGDGIRDVVSSAYTLMALDGATGRLLWRAGTTRNRTWPGIVMADIDKDGARDIVIAQSGGYLTVYTLAGQVKWQRRPVDKELRGLMAADIDGNGSTMELIVTAAQGSKVNTWVYDSSGNVRTGWPQMRSDQGYAWGVYNANAAVGNLDPRDPALEIVVPSDVHYINAYTSNGTPLRASTTVFPGKTWGQVGVWESQVPETRGWGACNGNRAESYRTNFADGPAVIADLNNDGIREVVVTGNMYDCQVNYPPSRYTAAFIFNRDRTRWNAQGFDWRNIPRDTGAPIAEDYNVIQTAVPNPAVGDLDGDGRKEIVYPAYDGRMHAVWIDKQRRGAWPYSVYTPAEGILRFASEPTIADLDADGRAEVIFTSWPQGRYNRTGKLHILAYDGRKIAEVNLPAAVNGDWNGGLAAPTLGNIDADPDLEIIVNTAKSGVVAYDVPGTPRARILWGTGRGNYLRNGTAR